MYDMYSFWLFEFRFIYIFKCLYVVCYILKDCELIFKYERIGNDMKNKLLFKDCVSCFVVYLKVRFE